MSKETWFNICLNKAYKNEACMFSRNHYKLKENLRAYYLKTLPPIIQFCFRKRRWGSKVRSRQYQYIPSTNCGCNPFQCYLISDASHMNGTGCSRWNAILGFEQTGFGTADEDNFACASVSESEGGLTANSCALLILSVRLIKSESGEIGSPLQL